MPPRRAPGSAWDLALLADDWRDLAARPPVCCARRAAEAEQREESA